MTKRPRTSLKSRKMGSIPQKRIRPCDVRDGKYILMPKMSYREMLNELFLDESEKTKRFYVKDGKPEIKGFEFKRRVEGKEV